MGGTAPKSGCVGVPAGPVHWHLPSEQMQLWLGPVQPLPSEPVHELQTHVQTHWSLAWQLGQPSSHAPSAVQSHAQPADEPVPEAAHFGHALVPAGQAETGLPVVGSVGLQSHPHVPSALKILLLHELVHLVFGSAQAQAVPFHAHF